MTRHRHRRNRPHHLRLQKYFSGEVAQRGAFLNTHLSLGPASEKGYRVYLAIEAQLEAKGFPTPQDDSWSMKDDYGYSETEMRMMLVAISADLATHGFNFKVSAGFVITAAKGTLEELRTGVSDRTTT